MVQKVRTYFHCGISVIFAGLENIILLCTRLASGHRKRNQWPVSDNISVCNRKLAMFNLHLYTHIIRLVFATIIYSNHNIATLLIYSKCHRYLTNPMKFQLNDLCIICGFCVRKPQVKGVLTWLRLAPLEPQGTSWKLWPPCYCKRENVDARATLAIEDDIITRLSIYSLCTPRSIQLPKQQCINTLKTAGIIETRWARQPLTVLTSAPQWTTLLAKLWVLLFFIYIFDFDRI